MDKKSPDAFRTISEVAEWLGVPTHVLRFWESRFSQVKPVKRAGGRRYYRPNDMELLGGIRKLLHQDGMTIRGVQKLLREEGVKHVAAMSPPLDSDEMRDVTPSNVVPLAGKSGKEDTSTKDAKPQIEDAQTIDDNAAAEPEPNTPPAKEERPVAAKSEAQPMSPSEKDAAKAPIESEAPFTRGDVADSSDAPLPKETAAPGQPPAPPTQPVFGSDRVASADQAASQEDTTDTPPPVAPELPGLQNDAESSTAAPSVDISHVPSDPGDDDAAAHAPLSSALRRARKSGTGANIAALQALADRLESLGAQMGRQPGQTP
ncbi:MerR family transcriptional regulator [Aliiroseovarius sp. S1339]|uniref:MerR family transcriptional regulator n=1 Tax=Aliiroseovarius sp. S1339 TaxID=2936990 RepID=UPI0020BDF4A6|nr:MerR family transcriptional regulator [Aliiroseovarius sp. S1339]MCK8462665.1 MerR family transcriptional regulator [Aliiroseovarius sp. S1339]